VALDWTLDLFFPRDITLLKVLLKTTVPAKADDYPAPVPQPADLAQHERALRMP
jgi:hypothetical protein